MEANRYRGKDPYPMPVDLKKNTYYAGILLDNYCGPCSEFTAVGQYIYHHLEASGQSEEASGCLRGIAVTEMHHLDMLGTVIRALGIPPKFRVFDRRQVRYWHSSYIFYGNSLRQMIRSDIEGEHQAIRDYSGAIRRIREPQIRQLLERIIQDEELHIQRLEELLREL